MGNFVYRNDDFNWGIGVEVLKKLHAPFEKAKVNHTLAAEGLPRIDNPIIDYIKSTSYWDVQIHCWEHTPYNDLDPETIYPNLKRMVNFIEQTFGVRPTKVYPPWGRTGTGPLLEVAAEELGLSVVPDAAFIQPYLNAIANGKTYFETATANTNHFIPYAKWRTVYFHHRDPKDLVLIPYLVELTKDIYHGRTDKIDFNNEFISKMKKLLHEMGVRKDG